MAAKKRLDGADLKVVERLTVDGIPRCGFVVAVRMLERLTPEAPRVGEEGPLSEEALKFRHSPSFSSQPNELESIRYSEVPRSVEQALAHRHFRYEITTCFLGLSGADSPMPLYHAADLIHDDEWSRRQNDFLDIFHNRILALFFRVIAKYDFPREFRSDGGDRSSTRVLALSGVDVVDRPDDHVSLPELLRLAGLFTLGGATARSIENGLRELLANDLQGVPLSLTQFTGGWIAFDPSQRNRLGQANNQAGETFVIGTRVRHPGYRAKITVGPLFPEHGRKFMPGGASFERARHLVGALCGEPLNFDLELLIREGAYPRFVLGKRTLGYDVCLAGKTHSGKVVSHVFDMDRTAGGGARRRSVNHGA